MIRILITLLSLASVAYTQLPSKESCPRDIPVEQNFTQNLYLGVWYEQANYPTFFALGGKCTTAKYTLRNDGNIAVYNTMINRLWVAFLSPLLPIKTLFTFHSTGNLTAIEGYAKADADEPAKLTSVFPGYPIPDSMYWVVSTDYYNYSMVWSCRDLEEGGSSRFAWILTRLRQASDEVMQMAYDVFDTNGISRKFLKKTSQTGCEFGEEKADWSFQESNTKMLAKF